MEIDYGKCVDRIVETARAIEIGKTTILTGRNGSGKSVVRKILPSYIAKLAGCDPSHCVASVSMQGRTELRSDFGAMAAIGHDAPDEPTSVASYRNVRRLFRTFLSPPSTSAGGERRFLVVDEPEIGCSDEAVLGLANYINSFNAAFHDRSKCLGLLVITHSRLLVRHTSHDAFLNLDELDEDAWLNREVKPLDFSQLEAFSSGLYKAIDARSKKKNC